MSKWGVRIPVYADAIYEVDADSEKEAILKAAEKYGAPMICHHCSDHIEINDLGDLLNASAEPLEE